jgi:hypothetical protein
MWPFLQLDMGGASVRYPNLRYGNPAEMAYYVMGRTLADVARSLRRDERTVRDWLSGRARVPWWVPEILRLRRMELEHRQRQMGMGALAPLLGIVAADVIQLAAPNDKGPHAAGLDDDAVTPLPAIRRQHAERA